jgi:hypothetical protein
VMVASRYEEMPVMILNAESNNRLLVITKKRKIIKHELQLSLF